MSDSRFISGSLLASFGIFSQVLIEYFTAVEAADFSLLTLGLVWAIIILGIGMIAGEFWKNQ